MPTRKSLWLPWIGTLALVAWLGNVAADEPASNRVVTAARPALAVPVTTVAPPATGGQSPQVSYSSGIADIVRLVDAGVHEEVVQAYIQRSSVPYHPSATEVVSLKEHGVPSTILTALLRRGTEVEAERMALVERANPQNQLPPLVAPQAQVPQAPVYPEAQPIASPVYYPPYSYEDPYPYYGYNYWGYNYPSYYSTWSVYWPFYYSNYHGWGRNRYWSNWSHSPGWNYSPGWGHNWNHGTIARPAIPASRGGFTPIHTPSVNVNRPVGFDPSGGFRSSPSLGGRSIGSRPGYSGGGMAHGRR